MTMIQAGKTEKTVSCVVCQNGRAKECVFERGVPVSSSRAWPGKLSYPTKE